MTFSVHFVAKVQKVWGLDAKVWDFLYLCTQIFNNYEKNIDFCGCFTACSKRYRQNNGK
jgi:hypothetical protein